MPHTGDNARLVVLDLLPSAASLPGLPTSEVLPDVRRPKGQTGRYAIDNGGQLLAVRLAAGQVS